MDISVPRHLLETRSKILLVIIATGKFTYSLLPDLLLSRSDSAFVSAFKFSAEEDLGVSDADALSCGSDDPSVLAELVLGPTGVSKLLLVV